MYISENMRNVCFQRQRKIHIKIELLNFKFQVVDELSGVAIDNPSISEDAESDIRRTCDITMVVKDASFEVTPGGKIWLDKYIRVYYGIEDIKNNNEVVWFNMGLYLINQPSYSYDAITRTLSFEGVDLMAKLTGMRNGQLEGIDRQIPEGSLISEVIIDTLKEAGFDSYLITIRVGENNVLYDVDIDAGSYVYDILTAMRDMYVTYQMYFDLNGVFHFEPIPSGADLSPTLTYQEISRIMTGYDVDVDFEKVKNYIEVYGMTYDADYYAVTLKHYTTSVTQSSGVFNLTISGFTSLADGDMIGFYMADVAEADTPMIKINGGTSYPILIEDYTTAETVTASETGYYIYEWNAEHSCFLSYPGWGLYSDSTTYHIIAGYTMTLEALDWVAFTPASVIANPKLQFNNGAAYYIYNEDMTTHAVIPKANETYIVEWEADDSAYFFIGYLQPKAVAYDNNPDSPFYVNGPIGQIRLVCAGDEYDNIATNVLAQNRADFELWNYCRLQDTVTITMLPVPFLNVYDLISFKAKELEEPSLYLVKSISTDLSYTGTQEVTAYKYYPEYQGI